MTTKTKIISLVVALALIFTIVGAAFLANDNRQMLALHLARERDEVKFLNSYLSVQAEPRRLLTYDYSYWDEMVDYVKTQDSAWATENLDVSLVIFKMDGLWVLDPEFRVVYSIFDYGLDSLLPMQMPFDAARALQASWFNHFFAYHDSTLLELFTAPIQPSSDDLRETNPQGYFVTVKKWNREFLTQLSLETDSEICDEADCENCRVKGLRTTHEIEVNSGVFAFDIPLLGRQGDSVTSLCVVKTNEMFGAALTDRQRTISFFLITLICITGGTILALIWLVYHPLSKVTASLVSGDPRYVKPLLSRKGEFAALAGMLTKFFAHANELQKEIDERTRAEIALQDSEIKYRSLIEGMSEAVFTTDLTGKLTYASPVVREICGYPLDEMIGSRFFELALPEFVENIRRYYMRQFISRKPRSYLEFPIRSKSGAVIWIGQSGSLIRNEDEITGFHFVARDVTERRAIESALRESEERFRTLFEQNLAGVYRTNESGEILEANEAFAKMLGYASVEEIKTQVAGALYWNRADRTQFIEQLRGERALFNYELPLKRRDDSTIWISENVVLIPGEDADHFFIQGTAIDITSHKYTEEALRESEFRYRSLVDASPNGIIVHANGEIILVNKSAARMVGAESPESLIGRKAIEFVHPDHRMAALERIKRVVQFGEIAPPLEERLLRLDGNWFEAEVSAIPFHIRGQKAVLTSIQDVTEKKGLEDQLRQAQKMEAVGRLAGGIAHDFNNLLTVITGHTELILSSGEKGCNHINNVCEIRLAADRAASLTHQLLAFSRKQTLIPKVVDLNLIIAGMEDMLRRLIGEQIELCSKPNPNLWKVKVDVAQIEQLIVNLAINSRDAMPSGGRLTIESSNIEVDAAFLENHSWAQAGPHVMLAVSDTGHGMSREIREKIFEPFFTTKGVGKGSGLGLSMVFGVMKQSGGFITVQSEPGQGATFRLYFPKALEPASSERSKAFDLGRPPQGTETLLVVEDEAAVRKITVKFLEALGYQVIQAADGREALGIYKESSESISLVITDMTMPNIGGKELAALLRAHNPDVKILYMSGYTTSVVGQDVAADRDAPFITKPYQPRELARKVRELIDRKA